MFILEILRPMHTLGKYCINDPRELLSQRVFVYIQIVNKRPGCVLSLSKHSLFTIVIAGPCRIRDKL